MKKMMMAVAAMVMAVVLVGCARSPSSVAEKFANAIIQGKPDKAVGYCPEDMKPRERANMKDRIDKATKEINDDKCVAESMYECVKVPAEGSGYAVVNGKRFNGSATVLIQFVKDKDKKQKGLNVHLIKRDDDWVVVSFLCDNMESLLWLREEIGQKDKKDA